MVLELSNEVALLKLLSYGLKVNIESLEETHIWGNGSLARLSSLGDT